LAGDGQALLAQSESQKRNNVRCLPGVGFVLATGLNPGTSANSLFNKSAAAGGTGDCTMSKPRHPSTSKCERQLRDYRKQALELKRTLGKIDRLLAEKAKARGEEYEHLEPIDVPKVPRGYRCRDCTCSPDEAQRAPSVVAV
jgi:hypothetical protein